MNKYEMIVGVTLLIFGGSILGVVALDSLYPLNSATATGHTGFFMGAVCVSLGMHMVLGSLRSKLKGKEK